MERLDRFTLAAWLVALPRYTKRTILAVSDFVLLNVALWLALSLRLGEAFVPQNRVILLTFAAAPAFTLCAFFAVGLYRSVTRAPGRTFAKMVTAALVAATLCWGFAFVLADSHAVPWSVLLLYPMMACALVLGSRHVVGNFLRTSGVRPERTADTPKRVIIYGAGATGMQLSDALQSLQNYKVMGFVDPSATLPGQYIGRTKVFRSDRLAELVKAWEIDEVLIAMPKAQRADQRRTLRELEGLNVGVRLLPAMEDVAAGRVTVSDLRPVDIADLLGRDPVAPDPSLMASNIAGRHVMVTGAGGSIGAELTKQILRQHPARLVLVDMSEAHLHQAGLELQALVDKLGPSSHAEPVVVSILGSILDAPLIRRAIQENRIETIYHAAAFKHVPIVEQNPVVGLQNNTFGTSTLADIAAAEGVKMFVLVSTDKAVRPTSVMGASKRLAEIVLQVKSTERHHGTVFTIVRFGNVLDSSGSVLRRFRTQIESGGPITVTHPDMVRYFMSIPEAAALVIQAGALAEGGDIFVLDMGEPVRIVDLARSMIHLMGREVRDVDNPDGDIAITFVGTRAGEKLFEEVALGEGTSHPRIWRCTEPFPEKPVLDVALDALQDAMSDGRTEVLREALGRAVETYAPNGLDVPRAA